MMVIIRKAIQSIVICGVLAKFFLGFTNGVILKTVQVDELAKIDHEVKSPYGHFISCNRKG